MLIVDIHYVLMPTRPAGVPLITPLQPRLCASAISDPFEKHEPDLERSGYGYQRMLEPPGSLTCDSRPWRICKH